MIHVVETVLVKIVEYSFNELSPEMRWHSSHKDGCRSESGDSANFVHEPWHRSEYIHTILWWGTKYLQAHHNCVRHYAALITIGHNYANVIIMLIPTTGATKILGVYVLLNRNICPQYKFTNQGIPKYNIGYASLFSTSIWCRGPLLLTWVNLNPSMDK